MLSFLGTFPGRYWSRRDPGNRRHCGWNREQKKVKSQGSMVSVIACFALCDKNIDHDFPADFANLRP